MSVRSRSRLDFLLAIFAALMMLLMIATSASALEVKAHPENLDKQVFTEQSVEQSSEENPVMATVIAYSLKVYDSPTFSETTDYLDLGQEVKIIEAQGNIALVEDNDGTRGWTASQYLAVDGFPLSESPLKPRETPLSPDVCDEYCWVTNRTWFTAAPQHTIGRAVFYAPYVMQYTAESRGMSLDGFVGGVAMESPADIGQVVWLRRPGHGWEGPYLVVDASQRNHMWNHAVVKGQSVEVDFDTALRWGMVTQDSNGWTMLRGSLTDIEVWKGTTAPQVSSEDAIPYRDFFLSIAELGGDYDDNWMWSPGYATYTNYDEYSRDIFPSEPMRVVSNLLSENWGEIP